MSKHLNKKNLCIRKIESFVIKDDDLYNMSMIRIKNKTINYECIYCNKTFFNNNNLKRHIDTSCKFKENNISDTKNLSVNDNDNDDTDKLNNLNIINSNNINCINSNNNNIINNNININISIPKSFDEEWDTSNIDINKKLVLLLTNSKFTKTLEKILENEVNLNVLIDNTNNTGLVYKNNKLVNMNIKDIVKKSMEKLDKHLCDFYKDIIDPNILEINSKILNDELINVKNKYNIYKKDEKTQDIVNKFITDIYNKKKDNTVKTYISSSGF
jgi:hypothetical protein